MSVALSVAAGVAALAVVLLFLRFPRLFEADPDERVAAVTMDFTARMEALRRELSDELDRAHREAARHRFLGEVAGAPDLDAVVRRTLETATALTSADGALIQTGGEQPRILGDLGLSKDEAARLTIVRASTDTEPRALFVSYRFGAAEAPRGERPVSSAVAVTLPGRAQPIGYLIAFSRAASRSFGEDDARTLAEIASRAGAAIDGALQTDEARALRDVDSLTGLANRLAFDDALTREVDRARRTRSRLALVLLDLDDFRAVNLRRGHEAGDAVLSDTAQRIRGVVGPSDVLARIGGDEFAVILPGATLDAAERLCARLQAELAPQPAENGLALSFSAGIAALGAEEDAGGLLRRADQALYHAQAGRGQVAVSDVTPRLRAS